MSATLTLAQERALLRDLAVQVAAIAAKPVQNERRVCWRNLNSLRQRHPLIHVRGGTALYEIVNPLCRCQDSYNRGWELHLRQLIYRDSFGDDFIIEPWVAVGAIHRLPPGGPWGFETRHTTSDEPGSSYRMESSVNDYADFARMATPFHAIDENATAANFQRVGDLFGDILPLVLDRAPFYRIWSGDISTNLAALRGLDTVMYDMMDNPEWLHRVLAHMRDGILAAHLQAEAQGDWRLCSHDNQSTPYSHELADPSADPHPVKRKSLWTFMAAQELTLVGPAQLEEFMLRYQIPILSNFGLVSYGCCEDLTQKIPLLRAIPNLRRIAVAPLANVAACAKQIGADYVVSYRPSPADTVCCGFDERRIRNLLRRDIDALRQNGCFFEINMKDILTLQGEADRLRRFVNIARDELAQ